MTDKPTLSLTRIRPRADTSTINALLAILTQHTRIHIPTAALAFGVTINALHQAAHRLREDSFSIETLPGPPWNQWTGPAQFYKLTPGQDVKATLYLGRKVEHLS